MKIDVIITEEIPMGLHCRRCNRKEEDKNGNIYCSLFSRFIWWHGGDYLKCRECLEALYNEIERNH